MACKYGWQMSLYCAKIVAIYIWMIFSLLYLVSILLCERKIRYAVALLYNIFMAG